MRHDFTKSSQSDFDVQGPCGAPFGGDAGLALRLTANMGMVWGRCKRLRDLPNPPKTSCGARPWVAPPSKIDPLAAVGGEQMQLLAWRDRPDSLADGRRDGAGNPHNDLARRQFPGIGGNALHFQFPGTVNEGLGSDALDRLHGEAERNAARDGVARNHKVLGPDPPNTGVAGGGAAVARELRFDFARPQRHQSHWRRAAGPGGE